MIDDHEFRRRCERSNDRFHNIAGVASPVYDAAGNYVMPAMNGEMAPADAAKQMKDDLQGQAK